MSVLCSDSDDDLDCHRINSYSEAYKKGQSGPTTCFSPKSHSVQAYRSKLRPLRLIKGNAKQARSIISSPSGSRRQKSPPYEGNTREPLLQTLPTKWKNSAAVQKCTNDLNIGPETATACAATNAKQDLALADVTLVSQSNNLQKTPDRSEAPMLGTTMSADLSLRVNQAQTPSVGNRTFSRRTLSSRTPTKATPRRRRKKRSPPLPPYKYLMTDDIPEDEISSYSSNDTHAIRTKGSMMLESFRLAGLENPTDKMLEIEKWRLDSSNEWPPCT